MSYAQRLFLKKKNLQHLFIYFRIFYIFLYFSLFNFQQFKLKYKKKFNVTIRVT